MSDTTDDPPFHMVQMWVDGRQLTEVGKMLGLKLRKTDNHYLAHCLLGKLFGDAAPKPYWLEDDPRREDKREMRLLGYCEAGADELASGARMYAEPSLHDGFDFGRLVSKPMPGNFAAGMALGFELRACPVIRKGSAGPNWDEGQEVDAFLSRVWEVDDESVDIDREEVYCDWLERQLDHRGGAVPDLETVGMKRFSLEEMVRRDYGSGDREVTTITRPDVTLTGELEVTDSEAFLDLLERGLGRHKSFGFGMMKVRPA
jgi:CRISPR system Cascade subunit CasE